MKVNRYMAIYLLIVLPAQIATSETIKREYWPTEQWKTIAPIKAGFDDKKINSMDAKLIQALPITSSLLIVRNGYLVHEKYFQGDVDTLRQTWSQTKSIISVLIGVLISRGKLKNVDQNLLALLPELQSR